MVAPCKKSGTCSFTIKLAKPSAIAVLPTPASPTKSGLFLRRRVNTCKVRSSSESRPINGSILPFNASSFKFCVKFSMVLGSSVPAWASILSLVNVSPSSTFAIP